MKTREFGQWEGRPIVDMSREELIEVINGLARQIDHAQRGHLRTLEVWTLSLEARSRS